MRQKTGPTGSAHAESVLFGGVGETADLVRQAHEMGIDPVKTLNSLLNGIKDVDRRYAQGRMDINDIMWSSINVKEALDIIDSAIRRRDINLGFLGRVVFGTVHGDIQVPEGQGTVRAGSSGSIWK